MRCEMSVKLIPLLHFKRKSKRLEKRYDSLIEDIAALGKSLIENPKQGKPLGAGLYKMRMASESKGGEKSGGFRIITYSTM
jgi:hypothetical protein